MEKCKGGDLYQYLSKRSWAISEDVVKKLTHQIVTALYYLHSHGIVHGDVKLENILMTDDLGEINVKLADFGFSKVLGPNETRSSDMGTFVYCAPELLLGERSGKEVDLWALGITLYVLLTGGYPFFSENPTEMVRQTV